MTTTPFANIATTVIATASPQAPTTSSTATTRTSMPQGFTPTSRTGGDKWYYSACLTTAIKLLRRAAEWQRRLAFSLSKFYTSSKRPDASVASFDPWRSRDFPEQIVVPLAGLRGALLRERLRRQSWVPTSSWIGPSVFCNYVPGSQNRSLPPHLRRRLRRPQLRSSEPEQPSSSRTLTTSRGHSAQMDLTAICLGGKELHVGLILRHHRRTASSSPTRTSTRTPPKPSTTAGYPLQGRLYYPHHRSSCRATSRTPTTTTSPTLAESSSPGIRLQPCAGLYPCQLQRIRRLGSKPRPQPTPTSSPPSKSRFLSPAMS